MEVSTGDQTIRADDVAMGDASEQSERERQNSVQNDGNSVEMTRSGTVTSVTSQPE